VVLARISHEPLFSRGSADWLAPWDGQEGRARQKRRERIHKSRSGG
jgi:hypothetical protein